METKITFGVIATNRNFFADSLVASGRRKVLDKLAEFGIDTVALSETDAIWAPSKLGRTHRSARRSSSSIKTGSTASW